MNVNGKDLIRHIDEVEHRQAADRFYRSIKQLPKYKYDNFYTNITTRKNVLQQSDGMIGVPVANLPDKETYSAKVIVFSNSCDIYLSNERPFNTRVVYAPILKLDAYLKKLLEEQEKGALKGFSLEQHEKNIRSQSIGHIFYLPKGKGIDYDGIVFFDRVSSISRDFFKEREVDSSRLFRLTSYGWYIFLARLATFYTRLSDDTVELRFSES